MCQFVHPNLVGHTYIADLAIGWLQKRAVSMLLEEWLSPGAHAHDSSDVAGMQVCTQGALLRCLLPAPCGWRVPSSTDCEQTCGLQTRMSYCVPLVSYQPRAIC